MDSAHTQPFQGYTTAQLEEAVTCAKRDGVHLNAVHIARMETEIARRKAVASGDLSNSTPGERLRALRNPH